MKMKKTFLAAAVLALAATMPAKAVVVDFQDEFSGGTNCANLVTGCATLEITSILGGVHFELTGTMIPGEFISGIYGNLGPFVVPTVANITGNTTAMNGTFQFSQDAFKADGDGFFDWKLEFNTSNAGGGALRFNNTDTLSWDFLGVTLANIDSRSVGGPIDKNGFFFATHSQGLFEGGSGWFNGTPHGEINPTVTPVPEPETYALMLAGLAAIGFMRKRRPQEK